MTAPLSDEQIAEMLDDCDNASAASLHAVCRHYVRALAAEVKRYRTEVARIADEFAEMKAELEATQAYGDEQRNRRKMAELQVEAIANELARERAAREHACRLYDSRETILGERIAEVEFLKGAVDRREKEADQAGADLARAVELLTMIDRGHPDVAAFLAEQREKRR